ncbi:MBL fold metallo-hydrolase [Paenibacillus tuaregi]|uniref:MBL fold metallo-hydrolase n=1 Tax=Paenibacillus tuaregi TaxID=1816681 RepID=UPI000839725C|nr:MBL fold metallo-hydrolase [Paenibacillus tuaregi]
MNVWLAIAIVLIIVVVTVYLYIRLHPIFGGRPSEETRKRMNQSGHYSKGKFINLLETSVDHGLKNTFSILRDMLKKDVGRRPAKPLKVVPYTSSSNPPETAAVTWFGHSALLLELDGKRIFLDPMLGRAPSPTPIVGGKRYSDRLPCEIDELPELDAVILSHDHYDHLDFVSILKLRDKVKTFFVPLGVAAHLERWGVHPGRIREYDWGEEGDLDGIRLVCTPARHFSGRSLSGNSTLWCSWAIHGREARIFYSGDSGYGPHFAEIGRKYGPFDLTLMECGQYDPRWASIHMVPEESVQAHEDVRGHVMLPIHWGAFTLALHPWTEPVERARVEAARRGVVLTTPRIGETVRLGPGAEYPSSTWWRTAD